MQDNKPVIVALDFSSMKHCLAFTEKLDPALCRVKVGKELFTSSGPELIRHLQVQGFDIFLDLKFHDIPNTVAGALKAAADLGIWMVNVHASGGRAMLEAAREALAGKGSPLLTAVTVLTSLAQEDLQEIGITRPLHEQVLSLAMLAASCGLDGVVCSSRESMMLRRNLPTDFCLVTPGIRPAGDSLDDQKRVETPASAIRQGSTYLVIGRPLRQAPDPGRKLQEIMLEIQQG